MAPLTPPRCLRPTVMRTFLRPRPLPRPLALGPAGLAACILLLPGMTACETPEPSETTYYQERISPIFESGCVQQLTGCHLVDDTGNAAGNLALETFDELLLREDALPAYGPYPVGLLLLKAGPAVEIAVQTLDPPNPARPEERFISIRTDIRHNAGTSIALDARAYGELKQWIEEGYGEDGVRRPIRKEARTPCVSGVGEAPGFDPDEPPPDGTAWRTFRRDVQPILRESCGAGNCHGSTFADFFFACGDTVEEERWNFWVSTHFLADSVAQSELLRRPLAAARGGSFHEGGDVFDTTSDPFYEVLRTWGEIVVDELPEEVLPPPETVDPGLRFFANRVQPVLVRKGCTMLNCHSPSMFHDLRLNGGSGGVFAWPTTLRNHEVAKSQLALESPNPNASRLIAKNLFPPERLPGADGIVHRGGALLEDLGSQDGRPNPATADDCEGVDVDAGDLNEVPAYCVLARWHELERELAAARGELRPADDPLAGVVLVDRPPGDGSGPMDFFRYRPGADLVWADAALSESGAVTVDAASRRSLLASCPDLGGPSGAVDVRSPSVSWDGTRVAFAARTAADAPLRLYEVETDGTGCRLVPGVAASGAEANGIPIHDFDPAWAPDGRLVFASTRGLLDPGRTSYEGPSRTPASLAPNANLYVAEPSPEGEGTSVRQLTFLLNQELGTSFMGDGRVIFTAEKRARDVHQLAGRRINLDGGDYHPLFAQRGERLDFRAATEIVELPNRNLILVAGPLGAAAGGGALALVNRSLGPDQNDRSPADRAYLSSQGYAAPSAIVEGGRGAFRSPAALPGIRFLAACDLAAVDLTASDLTFDLCEVDPNARRARVVLAAGDGRSLSEVVAVYPRPDEGVFESRPDEANGSVSVAPGADDAIVHVQDFPLLATLLFENTREPRPIDPEVRGFAVWESLPPPPDASALSQLSEGIVDDAFGSFFRDQRLLGTVPLASDGSARYRLPGGLPVVMEVLGGRGQTLELPPEAPLSGPMVQREEHQFYPGERSNQSFPRRHFDGLCGGCHGPGDGGREVDVAVDIDVLTRASVTDARTGPLSADLYAD